MAVFITGDVHGDFSRFKKEVFYEQTELTKNDYLIVTGDFGGVWDGTPNERYWLDWLDARPFTTLFVSGNHENFDMLAELPKEEWHGGQVQKVRPSVIHLMRGQVYDIEGKNSSPWAAPAATTSRAVFWSRTTRSIERSCGS